MLIDLARHQRNALCVALFAVSSIALQAGDVTSKAFGKTTDGQPVTLYTMTNKDGMSVGIMDRGATVVNLVVPDRKGVKGDIINGFDSADQYTDKVPYFGATIGRYGNRIAKGKFTVDGKDYQVPTNDHGNSLHGGDKGFDKVMWKEEQVSTNPPSIRFTRTSPDGEEGYPGALKTSVTFTLTDKNALKISYKATTDKPTVLNLTNHTYFNLAGAGSGTILDQVIQINAQEITPVDDQLIPTGKLLKVEGTPWDFRKAKPIGQDIKATGGNPIGYDHNFVLEKDAAFAAQVYDPSSGRVMTVTTDQPGLQFYSGNFLDGTLAGKGGKSYQQYSAFCLETQHFPDAPNHANFASTVLKPGEVYETTSRYTFSTK